VSRFSTIREACCAANRALPATGLVDLTFGNVSICDREEGVIAIKPSGLGYDALGPHDIVILSMEGEILSGTLRPSSDTPTHRRLYLGFPTIGAIVHTHSHHAVAFAQAAREIPLLGTTHADYFRTDVPVTRPMTEKEINGEYEWETGNVIVERFKDIDPLETPAVLVRNHGPFAWGPTGEKTVETAQALEIVAKIAAISLSLNSQSIAPSPTLIDKHFLRKHGPGAYYGQATRLV